MTSIIDRRLNPRDKTLKNRQRFIDIHKKQIKESVKRILDDGSVKDVIKKNKVKVKPTSEPTFRTDSKTGDKKYVLPGNEKHVVGDQQEKEQEGSGGGRGNEAGRDCDGEDDFEFTLTEDEFMEFVFDELELPDMVKKQIKDVTKVEYKKAGFKTEGNPSQLDIVRSMKNAIGRRIGLKRPKDDEIKELEWLISTANEPKDKTLLEEALEEKLRRRRAIPWIDPFDIRYRNYAAIPKPTTQAVMFCIMDVSYSMGEQEKEMAKRFFMLLHLFLKRKYEKIDVVFVSHTDKAREVDEEEFFYSKESGGTLVSSALELTNDIIDDRYDLNDWNIYVAQASDGDNFGHDRESMKEQGTKLLERCQYYAYVETISQHKLNDYYYMNSFESNVWTILDELSGYYKHMQLRQVFSIQSVWQVFAKLFSKERENG